MQKKAPNTSPLPKYITGDDADVNGELNKPQEIGFDNTPNKDAGDIEMKKKVETHDQGC